LGGHGVAVAAARRACSAVWMRRKNTVPATDKSPMIYRFLRGPSTRILDARQSLREGSMRLTTVSVTEHELSRQILSRQSGASTGNHVRFVR
jgi:hypothetical protein